MRSRIHSGFVSFHFLPSPPSSTSLPDQGLVRKPPSPFFSIWPGWQLLIGIELGQSIYTDRLVRNLKALWEAELEFGRVSWEGPGGKSLAQLSEPPPA